MINIRYKWNVNAPPKMGIKDNHLYFTSINFTQSQTTPDILLLWHSAFLLFSKKTLDLPNETSFFSFNFFYGRVKNMWNLNVGVLLTTQMLTDMTSALLVLNRQS